ncbi:MAG: hypothetical protein ACKO1F_04425 [Flammeovirgaceae bacterium]
MLNTKMEQAPARIFLATHRQEEKSYGYRSLCTSFNGNQFELQIKECALQSEKSYFCKLPNSHSCLVLPLSGNLHVTIKEKTQDLIVETAAVLTENFILENTYSSSTVHFLQVIWPSDLQKDLIDLTVLSKRNQLHPLFEDREKLFAYIGKYDGRVDGALKISSASEVFGYVVGGVFEFQNRLLQERDALWVSNINELAFEGLAYQGIILLFVVKGD